MKEVYTELIEGMQSIEGWHKAHADAIKEIGQWNEQHEKVLLDISGHLTDLLHLMKDMVGKIEKTDAQVKECVTLNHMLLGVLEGTGKRIDKQLDQMESDIQVRLSRMEAVQLDSGKLVDRLIEMSMVVKGQAEQAVQHRSQAGRDTGFETASNEDNDILKEEEWPPPGCDAMDVTG